jgi:D-alanyl-D-alanine carboxypeptidase (penicillin-binding protein 5/6)
MRARIFTLALSLSLLGGLVVDSYAAPKKAAPTPVKKAVAVKKPAPNKSEPVEAYPVTNEGGVPQVRAGSAIVVDARTGRVLHSVNPDQSRPVASTQKLLTAMIVAEAGNMDAKVRVEASDTWAEPSMLRIKPGEVYRRGDLLKILLVKSMNDVARCLARDNAGSIEGFAAKMNAKARQLGMTHSHFVNPNGLPAPGQYSTARDMAQLALHAYRNRTIRGIVNQKDLTWRYPDGHTAVFHNTNRVLKNYALCNGMKTGYTEASGFCLVSSAAGSGRDVISVVLGDTRDGVWVDSYRLLNWGLSSSGAE